jgi:hypothetical protein
MRWHYNTTDLFFKKYYERLLTQNMVNGAEMYIENYKDSEGSETECSQFFFPLKKDMFVYLIPSDFMKELPVLIERYDKISYSGKGYLLPKENAIKRMRIKPEATFTFRELVDSFATSKHSKPLHDTLWRMIAIILFTDRINVRVATSPEFGKDSKLNLLNSLCGEIGKISNPTIAKLEYLLFNKIILINEVSGINSQSKQDVEQFLLACGDFNNEYNKRSRAGAGSSEKYDISKLSLVIAYNDIKQYTNSSKYFDYMWTNAGAIRNRIIPFLFEGKVEEDYSTPYDIEEAVKKNWQFYIKFIRALMYYKENPVNDYQFKNNYEIRWDEQSGRWERNFITIRKWLSYYCKTQEEYDMMSKELHQCHLNYNRMLNNDERKEDVVIDNDPDEVVTETTEEPISNLNTEYIVTKYLDKFDTDKKGIPVETIMFALQLEDEVINKLKTRGVIYEPKAGFISLL